MKNYCIALLFIAVHPSAHAQSITQAEYFIDTDKGFGKNTAFSISPSADGNFPFTANLAGIAAGYHTLFLRIQDEKGHWSITSRTNIQVLPTSQNTVVAGEYFFDIDPGFGHAIFINITSQYPLANIFTASFTNLPAGYHKMFLRVKDANGNWGITSRYNVNVIKDTTGGKVLMVEYFFDTDPGFGNCAAAVFAEPAADGTFTFTIPQNNVPEKWKLLYMRVKDSANYNWSLTQWNDSTSIVLPLTLLNFDVIKKNTTAELIWETTHEVNSAYFNVQRSLDGKSFTTINTTKAKGNTNTDNEYEYVDDINLLKAGVAYYRLEMADIDGKITYSPIRYITIDEDSRRMSIYPNPSHNYFILANYSNLDLSNGNIVARDAAGRMMFSKKLNNVTEQKIDISTLSKGVYIISILTNGHVQTQKLLVE